MWVYLEQSRRTSERRWHLNWDLQLWNVLKFVYDDGCTTLVIYWKKHWIVHLSQVDIMICKLHIINCLKKNNNNLTSIRHMTRSRLLCVFCFWAFWEFYKLGWVLNFPHWFEIWLFLSGLSLVNFCCSFHISTVFSLWCSPTLWFYVLKKFLFSICGFGGVQVPSFLLF